MVLDIKVPSPGESITEVEISNWLVEDGDVVEKDQEICEIDSDKATLTVSAEDAGQIKIIKKVEETIPVGEVICQIDTTIKVPKKKSLTKKQDSNMLENKNNNSDFIASPAAKKIMLEANLSNIVGTGKGGRITKQDVLKSKPAMGIGNAERIQKRTRLSTLRRKLGARLVSVKNETAMLTTFNEIDMSSVNKLRNEFKEEFNNKHSAKLGYMSFFSKSVSRALKMFPTINSMIDGNDLVSFEYVDISIAVSSPKGLVVPVLRNVELMNFVQVEVEIQRLANKARNGSISLDDMVGGTFTITNGGVFGSMLSTPIINPPQSAILGMHNIVDRPFVIDNEIKIRPIMYVALSYDHRIIDGKESVGFLVAIKEALENPTEHLFGGIKNIRKSLEL
ncbi:MAG: dihydrolipoyllysine-residue succinyltransferase [Flavobacteriales bacterium]|jgi:2-oxoglutarate dehydrogenase E2 component (dihydrolipoamide succinyltransferase)|nr:dihydrolipoyllysine-residue succinyltransferase [Flavobacteriales bacterium]|tara:strand:+ start:1336 stop:2514 length:1179 start_codon:yes stop_codon:yes gene_type:complete